MLPTEDEMRDWVRELMDGDNVSKVNFTQFKTAAQIAFRLNADNVEDTLSEDDDWDFVIHTALFYHPPKDPLLDLLQDHPPAPHGPRKRMDRDGVTY